MAANDREARSAQSMQQPGWIILEGASGRAGAWCRICQQRRQITIDDPNVLPPGCGWLSSATENGRNCEVSGVAASRLASSSSGSIGASKR